LNSTAFSVGLRKEITNNDDLNNEFNSLQLWLQSNDGSRLPFDILNPILTIGLELGNNHLAITGNNLEPLFFEWDVFIDLPKFQVSTLGFSWGSNKNGFETKLGILRGDENERYQLAQYRETGLRVLQEFIVRAKGDNDWFVITPYHDDFDGEAGPLLLIRIAFEDGRPFNPNKQITARLMIGSIATNNRSNTIGSSPSDITYFEIMPGIADIIVISFLNPTLNAVEFKIYADDNLIWAIDVPDRRAKTFVVSEILDITKPWRIRVEGLLCHSGMLGFKTESHDVIYIPPSKPLIEETINNVVKMISEVW